MFKMQASINKSDLSYIVVQPYVLEQEISHSQGLDALARSQLPDELYGDELRLKQILINLVKNAIKFTIRGFITLIFAFDDDQGLLKVQVVDSGKGIRAEEMPKLFSMFGKLKRTAELNHEGIGMGLLISQNLVRLNGGTMTVQSDGED